MTEDEWLTGTDPAPMLEFHRGKVSARKLRLLACGCSRICWDQFTLAENRIVVTVAERIADGLASEQEMEDGLVAASFARDMATGYDPTIPPRYQERTAWLISLSVYDLAVPPNHICVSDYPSYLLNRVTKILEGLSELEAATSERSRQTKLLRDIFGNPFRPVVADPAWLTPTVVSIADSIYQDRAFDRLPILADALEEACCTNADLLLHCRQPGDHVRGCWAVDLVLGKV